jgi:hypothetical protein
MNECTYCEELNEEKFPIEITELRIQGGYYNWHCEIRHCPYCGKLLKKYDTNKDK